MGPRANLRARRGDGKRWGIREDANLLWEAKTPEGGGQPAARGCVVSDVTVFSVMNCGLRGPGPLGEAADREGGAPGRPLEVPGGRIVQRWRRRVQPAPGAEGRTGTFAPNVCVRTRVCGCVVCVVCARGGRNRRSDTFFRTSSSRIIWIKMCVYCGHTTILSQAFERPSPEHCRGEGIESTPLSPSSFVLVDIQPLGGGMGAKSQPRRVGGRGSPAGSLGISPTPDNRARAGAGRGMVGTHLRPSDVDVPIRPWGWALRCGTGGYVRGHSGGRGLRARGATGWRQTGYKSTLSTPLKLGHRDIVYLKTMHYTKTIKKT